MMGSLLLDHAHNTEVHNVRSHNRKTKRKETCIDRFLNEDTSAVCSPSKDIYRTVRKPLLLDPTMREIFGTSNETHKTCCW